MSQPVTTKRELEGNLCLIASYLVAAQRALERRQYRRGLDLVRETGFVLLSGEVPKGWSKT